jgi:hypothetical protein
VSSDSIDKCEIDDQEMLLFCVADDDFITCLNVNAHGKVVIASLTCRTKFADRICLGFLSRC